MARRLFNACLWIVSLLWWISLAWSFHPTTTLRVTFPTYNLDRLTESLLQENISYETIKPTVLQLDWNYREHNGEFFLHQLPVSKLSILLSEAKDPSALLKYDRSQMESVLHTWSQLGNVLPSEQGAKISFSISVGGKSTRGRKDKSEIDKSLVARIAKDFVDKHGWRKSDDKCPTLSFQIVTRRLGSATVYSSELTALVRVYPLRPSPSKEHRCRPPKRLESFFVAKSANIQPYDVVWDPFCQRATILIEAAKYWPLAHYHGMDDNLPNLEHAKMNADSTMTRLHMILQTATSGAETSCMPIPTSDEAVDKIVTCLPFGKSRHWYHQRIEEWSRALKVGGKMLLVIDQPSVPNLVDAVTEDCQDCWVEFQRNPTFLWGVQRATLLIVCKTGPSNPLDTKVGTMEWERDGADKEAWMATRARTIPQLVPFSRTNENWTNRIVRMRIGMIKLAPILKAVVLTMEPNVRPNLDTRLEIVLEYRMPISTCPNNRNEPNLKRPNSDDDELEWDDDDFELECIKVAVKDVGSSNNDEWEPKLANDRDQESDEWLTTLPKGKEKKPVVQHIVKLGGEKPHLKEKNDRINASVSLKKLQASDSSKYKGESFLTGQFQRLNTPVSRKKSRCVVCTRPVPDGSTSKYCERCNTI